MRKGFVMNAKLRKDAEAIARSAIRAVSPDEAVKRALKNLSLTGSVYLVAIGKAAWQMASAALAYLPVQIKRGVVVTKYDHVMGELPGVDCYEAGHPVPDEKSYKATQAVLDMTRNLTASDTVIFLVSGGGSALFEKPLVEAGILQDVTSKLLASGASVVEMNAVRKRLSAVKGGKFALWCAPAKVEAVILSDILGDSLDMIASGPAAADPVRSEEVLAIAEKYGLNDPEIRPYLETETPKSVPNVHSQVIGSVRELCSAAEAAAKGLGYETVVLSDRIDCEARDAGRYLAEELIKRREHGKKIAVIIGGETVVHLKGNGLGGRNQELALSAAPLLDGLGDAALISVGSDGTDGPTDAAGGYIDGDTFKALKDAGIDYDAVMADNDSYHALKAVDGLIITGPTGTNVNDVAIALTSVGLELRIEN